MDFLGTQELRYGGQSSGGSLGPDDCEHVRCGEESVLQSEETRGPSWASPPCSPPKLDRVLPTQLTHLQVSGVLCQSEKLERGLNTARSGDFYQIVPSYFPEPLGRRAGGTLGGGAAE